MSAFPSIADATRDAYQYVPDSPKRSEYSAVHFRMRLIEINSPDETIDILEPGKQYRVIVWTGPAQRPSMDSVSTTSALTLMLTLKRDDDFIYAVKVTPHLLQMPANETEFHCAFTLSTYDDLPYTKATLCLEYQKTEAGKPSVITGQPVQLAGSYNLIDTKLAKSCRINPAIERPEKTAFLYVSKTKGERNIQIAGWGHYREHVFETDVFEAPEIVSLANFVEHHRQRNPREMSGQVKHFFKYLPNELTRWFENLHFKHREDLILIVTDLTDFEIPWEMYPLSKGDYLGAISIVVRWAIVRNASQKRDVTLNVQEKQCSGHLVAYIDSFQHSKRHIETEQRLLQKMAHTILHSSQELCIQLESLTDVGLVYIGSHGSFVYDDPFGIGLGHRDNPEGRIPLFLLEDMTPAETGRPIFFVNACDSARWHHIGTNSLGLHETILGNFASAYIGLCGPVGTGFSLEAVEFILNGKRQYKEEVKGISLAKRLRDFRAHVLLKYGKNDFEKVLFSFMYVYYGNPLAFLDLSPIQATGDNVE